MELDDAPIGTIISRREALSLAARAGITLASAGFVAASGAQAPGIKANLIATPALTEGPFFVDEKLNRSNLLQGTTRPSVVKGAPLTLELAIYKVSGAAHAPLAGCQVDVWHCDAAGIYSDERNPMNHEDTERQTWLRGYQVTNAAGLAKFQTIIPGWYPGRTAHIHFKIRRFSEEKQVTAEFTSQLFFDEADLNRIYTSAPYPEQGVPAGTNLRDGIFAERQVDGSAAGSHLTLALRPNKTGYATKFAIALTDHF